MEFFKTAKSVRLNSHHKKYLLADDDEEGVIQDRHGSVKQAKWEVEFVKRSEDIIRLKSCYGKYLTASNVPFLLGMTGKKVLQTIPKRLDSSIEWEPIREGSQVKLKTRYGNYLRANAGLPPWRNSVTHDIPHRPSRKDWILWELDVVDIRTTPFSEPPSPSPSQAPSPSQSRAPSPTPTPSPSQSQSQSQSRAPSPSPSQSRAPSPSPSPSPSRSRAPSPSPSQAPSPSPAVTTSRPGRRLQRATKCDRLDEDDNDDQVDDDGGPPAWPPVAAVKAEGRSEGRMIHYRVADDNGDVAGDAVSFTFKGIRLEQLVEELEKETGHEDIILCSQFNGKLYPLRLQLPPNNAPMHIVVVPPTSKVVSELEVLGK